MYPFNHCEKITMCVCQMWKKKFYYTLYCSSHLQLWDTNCIGAQYWVKYYCAWLDIDDNLHRRNVGRKPWILYISEICPILYIAVYIQSLYMCRLYIYILRYNTVVAVDNVEHIIGIPKTWFVHIKTYLVKQTLQVHDVG